MCSKQSNFKVKRNEKYRIAKYWKTNSVTWNQLLRSFIAFSWMIIRNMKVLLNSFHLNGHTLGFHPQTQKLEPHCYNVENSIIWKYCYKLTIFQLQSCCTYTRVSSTGLIFRTTLHSIINSTTWKYCSIAFIWMVTHFEGMYKGYGLILHVLISKLEIATLVHVLWPSITFT